jgi:hypothetical protein
MAGEDDEDDDADLTPAKEPVYRDIYINFKTTQYMTWTTSDFGSIPVGYTLEVDKGKPIGLKYSTDDDGFSIRLNDVKIKNNPRYTDSQSGKTVQYELLGYSTDPLGTYPEYDLNSIVSKIDFQSGQTELMLYAVWKINYIVRFYPGQELDVNQSQTMPAIVASAGSLTRLPKCTFVGPSTQEYQFKYHNSRSGKWTAVESYNTGSKIKLYRFAKWKYSIGG